MKLSEIYKIADELAPKKHSDEYCARYGAYDNSGVQVDTGEDIKSVVFSLDLSFSAIDKAIETGANLIITHHPAIYGKMDGVRVGDFSPLGEKLVRCIKHGISVVSMHLNLDSSIGGTDECLQQGVLFACGSETTGAGMRSSIMHPLENGGYGRVYAIKETSLLDIEEGIKKVFKTQRVLVYGNKENKMGKVASFCGAGADEDAVAFAVREGAQLLVSSDIKHHVLSLALEKGLCVLSITHYASENYGFFDNIFQIHNFPTRNA